MNDRAQSAATCTVCPHTCRIAEGELGLCGARSCIDGQVVSRNFGEACALALDPIEKKPLAHFHPGSLVLSYGSYGCNLRCNFCQNSDISMARACDALGEHAVYISPTELVEKAKELVFQGNIGVALTYNEPLIAPEYLKAVGDLLHEEGLLCVVVTNGYITPKTFASLIPSIDAMNIDLKCFSEKGYETVGAPGGLGVVKHTIAEAQEAGIHVEVTTLVVPGLSDDPVQFEEECRWLASLDTSLPLHLSRFFPQYKMLDSNPTDVQLLRDFEDIARRYLEYVYLGNV